MNLSFLLAFIIIIALIAIPIFISKNKKNNLKKVLYNTFQNYAEKNELIITQRETWNSRYYIGIDLEKRKLLFLNKNNEKEDFTLIDLNKIKKCRANKISRSIKSNVGNLLSIDKIEINFTPSTNDTPEINIPFYIDSEDINLNHEILISEKWEKIINDIIKK